MIDAYVAGLVDGEGCISIQTHRNAYQVRVDIGMTGKAKGLLQQVQREYGGRLALFREATEKWDVAYTWGLFGRDAEVFLRRIGGLLILKSEQARVALKVRDVWESMPKTASGRARWTDEGRERCARLKLRMHELNKKGSTSKEAIGYGTPVARLVAGTWVTDQRDLFSDLGYQQFSETFPRSGSMRNGRVFARPTSARPTVGNAFSSLPTPRARDHQTGGKDGLDEPLAMLPTPSATPYGNNQSSSPGAAVRPSLDGMVRDLLPTPNAALGRGTGTPSPTTARDRFDQGKRFLDDAVALLPTPRATDGTKGGPNQKGSSGDLMLPSAVQSIGESTVPPSGVGRAS